jgi:hypothetical protein
VRNRGSSPRERETTHQTARKAEGLQVYLQLAVVVLVTAFGSSGSV